MLPPAELSTPKILDDLFIKTDNEQQIVRIFLNIFGGISVQKLGNSNIKIALIYIYV
jgi:hypothetical protein